VGAGHEEHEGGGGSPPLPANAQEIAASLSAWLNTPTWAESRAYLEAHPALLDAAHAEYVDGLLEQILQAYADNPEATAYLTGMRDLLTAARREGLEQAYARVLGKVSGGGGEG